MLFSRSVAWCPDRGEPDSCACAHPLSVLIFLSSCLSLLFSIFRKLGKTRNRVVLVPSPLLLLLVCVASCLHVFFFAQVSVRPRLQGAMMTATTWDMTLKTRHDFIDLLRVRIRLRFSASFFGSFVSFRFGGLLNVATRFSARRPRGKYVLYLSSSPYVHVARVSRFVGFGVLGAAGPVSSAVYCSSIVRCWRGWVG